MITALSLCLRIASTTPSNFSCVKFWVRLKIMVLAYSIWLLKNSPKFFIYILLFPASTTATKLLSTTSSNCGFTSSTAFITSESFPTPDGSIMIRPGWYSATTFFRASPKSPTREQQIQPEFISVMLIPASFRKPLSIPISQIGRAHV